MSEHPEDNLADLVTSPVNLGTWSKESICSFDHNYPIGSFKLEPGKKYGPFYKVRGENIDRFFEDIPEERNIVGLKKPRSKDEARTWYKPMPDNPLSHIHEFYIQVPITVTTAGGLIGKIEGATEFQIIFNNDAIQKQNITIHNVEEMPDSIN